MIGHIDFIITFSYIFLLGGMGVFIFFETIYSYLKKDTLSEKKDARFFYFLQFLPFKKNYSRSKIKISILVPLLIGFIVGLLLSMLGIGTIVMIPCLMYILRLPAAMIPGTSLFQIIFVACAVTLLHALTNHSVDIMLAFFLLIGGICGAPLGGKMGQKISPLTARFILSLLLIFVGGKLIYTSLTHPDNLYVVDVIQN